MTLPPTSRPVESNPSPRHSLLWKEYPLMSSKRRFGRIRKLPSGRYQVRYLGPDGRDHPAPMTFVGKREAERFLVLTESDIAKGRWIAPASGRVTVGQWADQWFSAAVSGLKPKTRNT